MPLLLGVRDLLASQALSPECYVGIDLLGVILSYLKQKLFLTSV